MNLQAIIETGMPAPDIIIEAKSLGTRLTDAQLSKLQRYAGESHPPVTEGIAGLTNGTIWKIYEVQTDGTLRHHPEGDIDIEQPGTRRWAEILQHAYLLNSMHWFGS